MATKKVKETVQKNVTAAKKARVTKETSVYDPKAAEKKAEKERQKASAAKAFEIGIMNPEFIQQATDAKAEYDELCAKIKEAHEIDIKTTELADIVNAFNATQEELEIEAAANKAAKEDELQAKIDELNAQIDAKKAELKQTEKDVAAETKQIIEDAKKSRQREQAEYDYEKTQTRKHEDDAWAISKATRESELATKEEDLKNRIESVIERENKMAEIEAQLKEAQDAAKASFDEGKAAGKADAEKAHGFETRYMKKEHEGAIKEKDMQIAQLQAQLADAKTSVEKLQSSLDSANKQNHELMIAVAQNAGKTTIVSTGEGSSNRNK